MVLRFDSLARAGTLTCALWLAAGAQDFSEVRQRAIEDLDKGACKEAQAAFKQALQIANERAGMVDAKEQVELALRLTDTSLCIGDYDDALRYATELQANARSAPADTLAQIRFLRAEAEKGKGKLADADANYAQAVEALEKATPPTDPRLARYLGAWSELARMRGDFAQADARIKRALAAVDNPAGRQSPMRAYAAVVAGDLERERGFIPEARKRYLEARDILSPKFAEQPIMGRALLGLALVDLSRGKLDLAEESLRPAEAIARRLPASNLYLQVLDARGLLELAKGNPSAARKAFENSLDARRKERGEQHPITAIGFDHLGLALLEQEKVDQAIEQFQRAEKIQRSLLSKDHPELATTLEYLGRAYRVKGDLKASATLDEALQIQIAKLGDNSPGAAATRYEIATLLAEQGKLPQAEASYRQVLAVAAPESRLHILAIRGLALDLHRQAKNDEAAELIAEWEGLQGAKLPLLDAGRLPVEIAAAEISLAARKYADAEKQFRAIVVANPGNPLQRYMAQKGLGDALRGEEKWRDAVQAYEAALPNLQAQPGVARSWEGLAECYAALGRWPESNQAAQTALEVSNKSRLPESDREAILLTIVDASVEVRPLDMRALEQWMGARAVPPSLDARETRILEKVAQRLTATRRYPMAEKVLLLLLGGPVGSAAPAANLSQVLAEFTVVCEAQNKSAEAAQTYERLARRMQTVRRLSDAEKYLEQANALREKQGDSAGLVIGMQALGDVYVQEGKNAEAQALFEQAGRMLRQGRFIDDARYAATLNGLGEVALAERNPEQAAALFGQAYDLLSKVSNPPQTILASVLFNLGSLKLSNGQMTEANGYFNRCLELSKARFTPENPPPVDYFDCIAAAYARQRQFAKAEEIYQSTLRLRRAFFGENSIEAGWGWYALAVFYNSGQAYDKAAEAGEKALRVFEVAAGPESPEAGMMEDVLAAINRGKAGQ